MENKIINYINLAGSTIIDENGEILVEYLTDEDNDTDNDSITNIEDVNKNKMLAFEQRININQEEREIIMKYSKPIINVIRSYQKTLNYHKKFMMSKQANANGFDITLIKKCLQIIKKIKIEDDERKWNVIQEALNIFIKKINNTITTTRRRIRIPDKQLDMCIMAALLKLDEYTVMNFNFDTKFIQFILQLDDPILSQHLKKVNSPFFIIHKMKNRIGFSQENMTNAYRIYQNLDDCTHLHQKTPRNLGLAIMLYVRPDTKTKIAKLGNITTINNIHSLISNYLDTKNKFRPFFGENYNIEIKRVFMKALLKKFIDINYTTDINVALNELGKLKSYVKLRKRMCDIDREYCRFFDPISEECVIYPFDKIASEQNNKIGLRFVH